MKKLVYLSLMFLFSNAYNQEQFFGNNNGLSFAYLHGYDKKNIPVDGVGFSVYLKSRNLIGLSFQGNKYVAFPSIFIQHLFEGPSDLFKAAGGFSFSTNFQRAYVYGINMSLLPCFLYQSSFPFSLETTFSIQTGVRKEIMGFTGTETIIEPVPVLGFGYTQALFAKNSIYPYIGFSYAIEVDENSYSIFSIMAGLNIKLGTKPANQEPTEKISISE